ncbi:MAG: helix-turn-helix domain-containing protein [Rhodospirillaceae bacterium]|nr:MAG: helix-turn-helix domain-containing protein [Rhodospirillaceae bacterium]
MPGGRPTLYRDEFPALAYKLGLLGLTDEELATFFEVHVDTIYEWDKVHPEFSEARARGKLPADAEVAAKLYHRARGYSHKAVKIFQYEGQPVEVPYTEHYPPDTQAATWWLKNRRSRDWKDRQEFTGADGGPIQVVTGVPRDDS